MEPENAADVPLVWRFLGQWQVIAIASIVLLMLTFNPLLTGFLPYLRAGWPALRTGFWLKKADPWKARGTVGLLFHLCLALFCAEVCAFFCMLITVIAAAFTGRQPDLTPLMVAVSTIAFGCILSSLFGWIGIALALRHRVRVFVMSNLYTVCHGDFSVAKTIGPTRTRTNTANYIIGVATAAPLLGIWFAAMLYTAAEARIDQVSTTQLILMCSLPVVCLACLAVVLLLSKRIMAQSPAECWGPEVPERKEVAENWYQRTD